MGIGAISLDLAENVFQIHEIDATGEVIFATCCEGRRC